MGARWRTWRGKQENIARFSSSTTIASRRTSPANARSLNASAANKPRSIPPLATTKAVWRGCIACRKRAAPSRPSSIPRPTSAPRHRWSPVWSSSRTPLPHAVVNTNCVVKSGCIVNCGAIVDHGCVLEEGVHICLGAIVKAENLIPRCMKIEAGEVVQNRTYPL